MAKKPATANAPKPRKKKPKPPAVEDIEREEDDEDLDDDAGDDADDEDLSDQLDVFLTTLGDEAGHLYASVHRTRPRRAYVTRIDDLATFDIEDLRREFGGGDYVFLIYRHGESGIKRRVHLVIDGAPRTAGQRDEAEMPAWMQMQLQQAAEMRKDLIEVLKAQTQPRGDQLSTRDIIELARGGKGGGIGELVQFANALDTLRERGGGGETNINDVILKGFELAPAIAAASASRAPGRPAPRRLPPRPTPTPTPTPSPAPTPPAARQLAGPAAQNPPTTAAGHPGGPEGGGDRTREYPQTPQSPSEAINAPAGETDVREPSGNDDAKEKAKELVLRNIQVAFSPFHMQGAKPGPDFYGERVRSLLGQDEVVAALASAPPGVITSQFALIVPHVPADFLSAVEKYMRETLKDDIARAIEAAADGDEDEVPE